MRIDERQLRSVHASSLRGQQEKPEPADVAVAVPGDVISRVTSFKVPSRQAVQQHASLDGCGEVLIHFIAQESH
jgi:hypothetical protein